MNWEYKTLPNPEVVENLAQELNLKSDLATILVQRGITTFDEAKHFFRPELKSLHDPFLMKNMDQAVKTLSNALANNSKILIYGDYDVDGASSTALLAKYFFSINKNIETYIPDRKREGYGPSDIGFNKLI